MHHLIYLSRATQPMSQDELLALLAQARMANAAQHITGALLYGNGQFLQVIEGERAAVQALYERLLLDPRHTDLVKFADKAITDRSFADWSMAFQPLAPAQFADLLGFVSLDEVTQLPHDLSAADTLLLQTMRSFVTAPEAA